jgi:hypothetical protein
MPGFGQHEILPHPQHHAIPTRATKTLQHGIVRKAMPQAEVEVVRQPRISRGKPDNIRSACRKLQAGENVISLQIGEVGENLAHINSVTHHFKNIVDTNAHSSNARTPATFTGCYCDAIKQI